MYVCVENGRRDHMEIHTHIHIYMYLRKKMRAVTKIGKHLKKRCNEVTFRTREE
jgi:hypothetical protein